MLLLLFLHLFFITDLKKKRLEKETEIDDTNETNKKMMDEAEKQNKAAEDAGLFNKLQNILGK